MSYVEGTVSLGAAIARGLVLLLALLLCLAIALTVYVWFVSRPIAYVMHAEMPTPAGRVVQLAQIDAFRRHGACEHLGKPIEWKGRPALAFNVHPDFEEWEVGCIRVKAPIGFMVEERGWFS